MRVTIHTEIEPPERRPCLPLPLDGPILVEAVPLVSSPDWPTLTRSWPASVVPRAIPTRSRNAPTVRESALGRFLPAWLQSTAMANGTSGYSICRPGLAWMAAAFASLFFLGFLSFVDLATMLPRPPRESSCIFTCHEFSNPDVKSGFCLAWRGPDTSLTGPCPRWALRVEACWYMGLMRTHAIIAKRIYNPCLTDARRGFVNAVARGLMRASLALDAKRVYDLCLLITRRGVTARGLMRASLALDAKRAYLICPQGGCIAYSIEIAMRALGRFHVLCLMACMALLYTFLGSVFLSTVRKATGRPAFRLAHSSIADLVGGGRRRRIDGPLVADLVHSTNGLLHIASAHFHFEYQCVVHEVDAALTKHPNFIAVDMPLKELVKYLTRAELTTVAQTVDVQS
ncbi:hypothetical protein B0H11DRAFT_236988 [Mycena galericulata]|nr:hypothetical protein B0H11DRAFT_236988 [Mycena galericulata]